MLYTPFKIRNLEFKNRWIMLAMHTGFAEGDTLTERELAFYEARARGGAAAVTLSLGVNEDGSLKGMRNMSSLRGESLKAFADMLHGYNCRLIIQLFHCGRNESEKNHEGKRLLAPSAVPSSIFKAVPKELSKTEMTKIKRDFADTTCFCRENGADCIEISASAGYLLSEFLSPLTNERQDEYGYENQNGMTYPIEVIKAVREAAGDMPVFIKASAAQLVEGGYGIEETIAFCKEARPYIDCVSVTGGWHESPVEQISYHVSYGAYAPLAGAIKKIVNIPIIACNRIHNKETAQRLLEEGVCDLAGTARAFLADPNFAVSAEENKSYLPCQGCNRCIAAVLKGEKIYCGFNPEAGMEYFENKRRSVATRKEVLVAGGGPGGMEAAKKAAERGFATTLITEDKVLGGQLRFAALPPKKSGLRDYIDHMEKTLRELGVRIVLGERVTGELILEKKPYFTIIAIGSRPQIPDMEGAEMGFTAREALSGAVSLPPQSEEGQTVIIGGGSVGLETAAYIKAKEPERKIKILEASSKFGKDMGALARPLVADLKEAGVQLMADTKVLRISEEKVFISIAGREFFIQADGVIFATGSVPEDNTELTLPLMDERLSYAVIGDGREVRDGAAAIHEAYDIFTGLYLA